jgi:hypothetical protein
MMAAETASSSNKHGVGRWDLRRVLIMMVIIAFIFANLGPATNFVEGLTPPTLLGGDTTVTRASVGVSTTRLAYRYLGDDDNSHHNYLESLSHLPPLPSSFDDDASLASARVDIGGITCNNNDKEDEVKFRTLQTQRDTIINTQRQSMLQDIRHQKAMYTEKQNEDMYGAMLHASRRTFPKEVLSQRITEGQLERRERERERLEMQYVEKMTKLEWSKQQQQPRENNDEADSSDNELESSTKQHRRPREVIPILDILSRPPIINLPPLLLGETLLLDHEELTPFQLQALDVALSYHHVSSYDSSWCSAPLVAVIDSYTANTEELPVASVFSSSSRRHTRYATLASVEIINDGDNYGSVVKLIGVGRALLCNYFSSSGAISVTQEEGELSDILAQIQELNKVESDDDVHDYDTEVNEEDEEKLPVIMAEFDVLLDDPSIIYNDEQYTTSLHYHHSASSSRHAITNLFNAANRVYRVFDERKRLIVGLRAGASRLRQSQSDNALYYNDSARNELEGMENYGITTNTGMMSTIPELTNELLLQLQPYYSQEHREREEYEVEVASMAILKTLEVTPTELATLLLTQSATRRLELEFDIIMRHKEKLHQLVRIINDELIDCGEKCTDLW